MEREIRALLTAAEQVDAAEDAEYGRGRRGDELPAELARRESRLAKIRAAKAALEQEAKDRAVADAEEGRAKRAAWAQRDPAHQGRPPKIVDPDQAVPEATAQRNFTDPESRIMKGPDGFVQAYNAQVAVDDLQLIVGHAVTQETNDKKQLMPMVTTIARQSGETPTAVLANAGYCSDER